jgi:hypothetical protein
MFWEIGFPLDGLNSSYQVSAHLLHGGYEMVVNMAAIALLARGRVADNRQGMRRVMADIDPLRAGRIWCLGSMDRLGLP